MRLVIAFICIISIVIVSQPIFAELVSAIDKLDSVHDIESCKKCHGDIAVNWDQSLHAESAISPSFIGHCRICHDKGNKKGINLSPLLRRETGFYTVE